MNKNRTNEEILESIYLLVNEAQKAQITYRNNGENLLNSKVVNQAEKSKKNIKKKDTYSDWSTIDFSKSKIEKKETNPFNLLIRRIFHEEFSKWLKRRPKWVESKTLEASNEFVKERFKNI